MGQDQDLEALQQVKEAGCPCVALCCIECQCNCSVPCFIMSGKVCCCDGWLQLACPCAQRSSSPCFTDENGCCEFLTKLCCLYLEVQLPPGTDIGIGCCGCRLTGF